MENEGNNELIQDMVSIRCSRTHQKKEIGDQLVAGAESKNRLQRALDNPITACSPSYHHAQGGAAAAAAAPVTSTTTTVNTRPGTSGPRGFTSAAPTSVDKKVIKKEGFGNNKMAQCKKQLWFHNRNDTKEDVFVRETIKKE